MALSRNIKKYIYKPLTIANYLQKKRLKKIKSKKQAKKELQEIKHLH